MNNRIISIIAAIFLFILFFSCEKEDKQTAPIVETASVGDVLNTSAAVGGRVMDDGGAEVSDRGIYWGTTVNPEESGTKLQIGTGLGIYSDTITGLTPGVKYYVKAYASNSKGTSYGEETSFTTQINFPTVSTAAISDLAPTSAKVGGNVTDDGGFEVTQRGVYWGSHANPTLTGIKLIIGNGEGEFSQTLSNLNRNNTYYVVAFATNIRGTSYGDEISFTTVPTTPSITTMAAVDVTAYTAKLGGEVTSNGGSEITDRGVYWGESSNPQTTGTKFSIGTGSGEFSDTLENLNPGITYYFVAYATNSMGTSYGDEQTFNTLGELPVVTTSEVSNLSTTSVTLSGIVSAKNLNTVVTFEYGTTTSYGNTAIYSGNPVTEDDDTVSVNISGLTSATTYHYRVKAENELGVIYGADSIFKTVITGLTGTVTDYEGNVYQTIGIGYQQWMTENLRSTKFNDGSAIPVVKEDTSWVKLDSPAYCWYNNDSLMYSETYGALYNWFAVNTDKLCPSGWHIPTNEEFTDLVEFLGSSAEAGGFLKETGTFHWKSPNSGATDDYGFTALPGGKRSSDAVFDFINVEGNYWSSSEYSTLTASYFYLLYNYSNSFQAYINKKYGMNVRCVKD